MKALKKLFGGKNDEKEAEKKDGEISKLPQSCAQLYNYKCKYKIGKDGNNLTFYPSCHLNDKSGYPKPDENGKDKKKDKKDKKNKKDDKDNKEEKMNDENKQENENNKKLQYFGMNDLEKQCSLITKTMKCDRVESAYMDHEKEINGQTKVLEAQLNYENDEINIRHQFIQAVELAWSHHLPIKIDPSHIWLLILQGVALHVDKHSEKLRDKWVKHNGKKTLTVIRNDFVKGKRANRWSEVISSFCEQIDEHTVEGSVELLESNFSNSTEIDKIATKVVIMDICKNYFEYVVMTECGFPQITLTGNKQDWINLYDKTEKLLNTKCEKKFAEKWSPALLPVLKRFYEAFDGEIDCLFWNSMIKRGSDHGSGGFDWFSGWINIFFPYIEDKFIEMMNPDNKDGWNIFCVPYKSTNDYIVEGLEIAGKGNDVNKYPFGFASAPVIWKYYDCQFKLTFISGFVGINVDPQTLELYPMTGWIIGETIDDNKNQIEKLKQSMQDHKEILQPN